MTREKAIEILKKHNEWRRDNGIPPKSEMQNPKEIGEAIDFAIEKLSSDKIVIELSDNELKIITEKELEESLKSAMEFDGFVGFIVKGILI